MKIVGIITLVLLVVATVGCVRITDGTWWIRSASTPENWPEITPVGEVKIKRMPLYRAAVVNEGEGMRSMFMELFDHIRDNDISMTAPVEMSYADGGSGEPRMDSMAFLYRTPRQGEPGQEGPVEVQDVEQQTVVSVGVRGNYKPRNFERGVAQLESWLEANADQWQAAGEPRYLGYNSPFVPAFMRYGEVQIAVRAVNPPADRA
jgi:hypothetical protein